MNNLPPRLKCPVCGGQRWFESDIGKIGCGHCNGSGEGDIDVKRLIANWKRLQARVVQLEQELERTVQCHPEAAIAFGKGL